MTKFVMEPSLPHTLNSRNNLLAQLRSRSKNVCIFENPLKPLDHKYYDVIIKECLPAKCIRNDLNKKNYSVPFLVKLCQPGRKHLNKYRARYASPLYPRNLRINLSEYEHPEVLDRMPVTGGGGGGGDGNDDGGLADVSPVPSDILRVETLKC